MSLGTPGGSPSSGYNYSDTGTNGPGFYDKSGSWLGQLAPGGLPQMDTTSPNPFSQIPVDYNGQVLTGQEQFDPLTGQPMAGPGPGDQLAFPMDDASTGTQPNPVAYAGGMPGPFGGDLGLGNPPQDFGSPLGYGGTPAGQLPPQDFTQALSTPTVFGPVPGSGVQNPLTNPSYYNSNPTPAATQPTAPPPASVMAPPTPPMMPQRPPAQQNYQQLLTSLGLSRPAGIPGLSQQPNQPQPRPTIPLRPQGAIGGSVMPRPAQPVQQPQPALRPKPAAPVSRPGQARPTPALMPRIARPIQRR